MSDADQLSVGRWLEQRPRTRREQPWIKGRQPIVGDVTADLALAAVEEAIAWVNIPQNAALIAA